MNVPNNYIKGETSQASKEDSRQVMTILGKVVKKQSKHQQEEEKGDTK